MKFSLSGMTTLRIKETPRAVRTEIKDATLYVYLVDGRVIGVPLNWYPRLEYGLPEERIESEVWKDGEVLVWPILDEHIPVEAIVAGRKSEEGSTSFSRWKKKLDAFRSEKRTPEWGVVKPLPANL